MLLERGFWGICMKKKEVCVCIIHCESGSLKFVIVRGHI